MSKTYRFTIGNDASPDLRELRDEASDMGVHFRCEGGKGSFTGGGLVGDYVIEGNEIVLTIHKVPMGMTYDLVADRVERAIREKIEG
ncbi:MAG: hypothetical protein ACLFUV_08475 [Methanomassiliicoccales archaeon]